MAYDYCTEYFDVVRRRVLGFLIVLIFLFWGYLSKRRVGTWTNPSSIMCYLWAIVCFSASLHLFNLNDVSFKTWFVILIGVISFSIGSFVKVTFGKKKRYIPKRWADRDFFLPANLFWILFIIIALSFAGDLIQSIRLMQEGYRLDVIRQVTMGAQEIAGYSLKTSTSAIYFKYIRSGFQAILIAVGIERFFADNRGNIKYILAVIFLVAADAFSNGGRWIIIYASIEFLICYAILRRKERIIQENLISRKARRLIFVIVVSAFLLMEKITTSRLSGGFVEHFYIYLCGCVPFLDYKLGYLAESGLFTGVFSSQYGVWSLIMPYLKMLTGNYPLLYSDSLTVISNIQVYEYISDHQTYNAFVTSFYTLFADFRWIGVVIGMLLFGIVCGNLFRKSYEQNGVDEWNTIVPYLVVSQMIIKSIQTYPLASNTYVVTLIIMFILFRVQNVKVIDYDY